MSRWWYVVWCEVSQEKKGQTIILIIPWWSKLKNAFKHAVLLVSEGKQVHGKFKNGVNVSHLCFWSYVCICIKLHRRIYCVTSLSLINVEKSMWKGPQTVMDNINKIFLISVYKGPEDQTVYDNIHGSGQDCDLDCSFLSYPYYQW